MKQGGERLLEITTVTYRIQRETVIHKNCNIEDSERLLDITTVTYRIQRDC